MVLALKLEKKITLALKLQKKTHDLIDTPCSPLIKFLDAEMSKEANLPIGPFELMDYIGLDTVQYIIEGWHRFRPDKELYMPSHFVSQKVENGHFGQKTGRGVYKY